MPDVSVYYLLLTFCLLLAGGLTVAAWRRPNRRRLALRLGASWLTVAGLWWLAYPPTQTVSVPAAEAVVLTPGYSADTLRRLLRQLGPAAQVWHYRPAQATPDTAALSSLPALRERLPTLRRLHVLGQGLPAADLPQLGPVRLITHPAAARPGFEAAHWNRRPTLGQTVSVEGAFQRASAGAGPVTLYLRAAGALRDSVQLSASQRTFRLRYQPKTAGRAVYELVARQRGQELAAEPVPVEVLPRQTVRVLLLAAAPSFEFRFLKNHLGSRQYAVALRTGLSRDLTQTEFLNQPAQDLSRLTAPLLARYDAVVLDAGSLAALTSAENHALHAALRTTGLGVIVLADAVPLPRNAPAAADFAIVPRPAAVAAALQPVTGSAAPTRPSALVPAVLRLAPTGRPLATTTKQSPVVGSHRVGAGTVVVSVLPATYPWRLQGQTEAYETYWSELLAAVARPLAPAVRWRVATLCPRPDIPLEVELETAAFPDLQPTVRRETEPVIYLALQQDLRLPEWSTATYWPATAGWHQLQLPAQPAHWFYVFAASDWQLPEVAQRARASEPWRTTPAAPSLTETRQEPWASGWFLLLFLLGAGFLWLEEKL